jgi:hydroxymethylpyrimidine kinase/phosphomethylpyrimidine kinase
MKKTSFAGKRRPVALTVAGSDSGGGAGVQADLRTFESFGVFGCSAVTALTAQNPARVAKVSGVKPPMVSAQILTVAEAFDIRAVKTGMLFSAGVIRAAAESLSALGQIPLVADPVMVSTSGARLLKKSAAAALEKLILPQASWITPNIPEAEALSGLKISSEKDMAKAAAALAKKFGGSWVVKGGHLLSAPRKGRDAMAVDIVFHEDKLWRLSSPLAPVSNPFAAHGTGCVFSAAFTAGLALGLDWREALTGAKAFVLGSLMEAVMTGEKTVSMVPPRKSCKDQISLAGFH